MAALVTTQISESFLRTIADVDRVVGVAPALAEPLEQIGIVLPVRPLVAARLSSFFESSSYPEEESLVDECRVITFDWIAVGLDHPATVFELLRLIDTHGGDIHQHLPHQLSRPTLGLFCPDSLRQDPNPGRVEVRGNLVRAVPGVIHLPCLPQIAPLRNQLVERPLTGNRLLDRTEPCRATVADEGFTAIAGCLAFSIVGLAASVGFPKRFLVRPD
jgi:hypothetical protein